MLFGQKTSNLLGYKAKAFVTWMVIYEHYGSWFTDVQGPALAFISRLITARRKLNQAIARKVGVTIDDVKGVIIWGNHSSTQYPDVHQDKVKLQGTEVGVYKALKDDSWFTGEFITPRQQHGTGVTQARKPSRAMSAAKASLTTLETPGPELRGRVRVHGCRS
ncbi:Malate dehydrogenase, cytoplasmic [Tupaia chinensis]|uniref:Malate dehydrogenase, cytoplasmic n=1 Tax=Tupaia chinensis TaxID=246437 RepID=L9JGQ5_TUPCH|nr:Malate dehydrogenase, cytoplasmic [Tupaia chinensis]